MLHEPAIFRLLGVPDLDECAPATFLAEPPGQDAIVLLAEGIQELLVGDVVSFGSERVPPRQPVQLRRVDEGAIQIPENCA